MLSDPIELTLLRVHPPRTLSHERSRYSAIEGLCGTSHRWTDRLRGNRGSEGRGPGRPLSPRQPRNRATPELRQWGAKKRGRIGLWGRHRCSLLQPIAVSCRAGDVSRRYSLPRRPFANVGVAGSSPVSCSRKDKRPRLVRSGAFSIGVLAPCYVQPKCSHLEGNPEGRHPESRQPPRSCRAASSMTARRGIRRERPNLAKQSSPASISS